MHSWMQARLIVWLMRSQESCLEEKYTSSPYWEVIFTDEILWVFLRDLGGSDELKQKLRHVSVWIPWILQRLFPRLPVTAEGGQCLLKDGICLNKNVKEVTSHWNGMNWWDILVYLLFTLNSYLVFSIQYLCLVFCRQSWCLCVANMEKEKTIHPHRRRSSIFAGVFCSLEASGRE